MADALRVLVNDDSPSDAMLIVLELQRELPCVSCETSRDRDSFLSAINGGAFDIIISDFSLPGFNAIDALKLTRQVDEDVPFIVTSGTIGEERAAELIRAGVTDYVMKDHLSRIAPMVERAVREARERVLLGNAERGLIEAANEWRDTVNAIPEAILMLDAEGIVRRTNLAAGKLPGAHLDDLLGKSWREVLGGMCPLTCALPSTPFEEARLKFEWGPCVDGESWFLVSYDPIHDGTDERKGFVMVFTDITQRKLADEAKAALLERLQKTLRGSVGIAIKMVESRDPYTAGHQENVAELAVAIGQELGMAPEELEIVRMAGELHDIGKIAVPAEILVRPGVLDETEWAIIRRHPAVAENILREAQFAGPVVAAIVQHHERLDGTGYPAGLSGEEIGREARILAVADVAEAMMAHRPYRPARPRELAYQELRDGRGGRYDPIAVDACLAVLDRDPEILSRHKA